MLSALLLALAIVVPKALAQDDGWPRTLPVEDGMLTIYPLQIDNQEAGIVRYRAALAWRESADAEPVFGAGWFESPVDIDHVAGLVHPTAFRVTETRFPPGTGDIEASLQAALARYAPGWDLDYSVDRLNQGLQTARAERDSLQNINTAPPNIVYRDHPALLVTVDGEPILRPVEDSAYQAVVNTPYPMIFDGRQFWLNVARGAWYRADAATGPYRFEANPPAAIDAMVQPEQGADEASGSPGEDPEARPITAATAPEIVVVTEPSELVVTDGPAAFVPLVDDLLVLQNSDDDLFLDVASQQYYIVLSGRWYRSRSLGGPWEYQAADELPPSFARIPENSEQAGSRVYVAGTPEAEEAVLDAQVPQTAAVQRGTADIEIAYDGDPEFAQVDGTDLQYAANTGATVLHSDRTYFLVEDGVWYISASPHGPWRVADYRPAAVDLIAPTSPVYNVRYVYIYDSTPDVVYVGYTPGYLGSYVYSGTVVYGTGWYYRPWVSPAYYYPRFSTWGFHVGYDSWGGWSFGLSWNWGFGDAWYGNVALGWGPYYSSWYRGGYWHRRHYWNHHYAGGYWGPRGYCPRPAPYHRRPYRDGHGRYAWEDRDYGGDRYGRGHPGRHPNLYRDAGQRARIASTQDKLPRERGWNANAAAGVRNAARPEDRRAAYGKPQAGTRARYAEGSVKPADIRRKANVREVNAQARQKLMLADSGGKVYRQPETRGKPLNEAAIDRARTQAVRSKPGQVPSGRSYTEKVQPVVPRSKPAQRSRETINARDLSQKAGRQSAQTSREAKTLYADKQRAAMVQPRARQQKTPPQRTSVQKPQPASQPGFRTRVEKPSAPVTVRQAQSGRSVHKSQRGAAVSQKSAPPQRAPSPSYAEPGRRSAPTASARPTARPQASPQSRRQAKPAAAPAGKSSRGAEKRDRRRD